MTPGTNHIYAGLERSCPRDSKNISYVDVGLLKTGLDLIFSYELTQYQSSFSFPKLYKMSCDRL